MKFFPFNLGRGFLVARERDWAKIDEGWALNKKVRKLTRKYGPSAGAYWAWLIARSYADSHHIDNPTGVIDCTLQDLADELGDRHNRADMWADFVASKLVTIKGKDWKENPEADVLIELVDFSSWQWPKGFPAKRQAAKREADQKAENSRETIRVRTDAFGNVTQTETETETEKEIKGQSLPVGTLRAHTGARTRGGDKKTGNELPFSNRLSEETHHAITKLLEACPDADAHSRGVLEALARSRDGKPGASLADFARALEAVTSATIQSSTIGYAVETIATRIRERTTAAVEA